ncbi:ATP-binding protein [Chitinophaga agri]|uniref:histidine kinase n=1 Tax=Chitinophaga agri TaxID=2703787 RepID=A0A6B9ZEL2_9BACT|nr:ATP-binding protein [Chitinophaga agri]QHS59941.1 PAS domain S-box protein [Chitinophaga agri]
MTSPVSDNHSSIPVFLEAGSEMQRRINELDWSATQLGPIANWPPCLRTTLGIMLNSRFPMFLFWGEKHICFYNDSYKPSLGREGEGKHPGALGGMAENVFAEIWPLVGPQIVDVMSTGRANWFEDVPVPMSRNGRIEDIYWTYSMSPVINQDNTIEGVLVVCTETLEKVQQRQALEWSESRFRQLFNSNIIGFITWRLDGEITEANDAFLDMTGYSRQDLENGHISWSNMTPPEWTNITQKGLDELEKHGYFAPFEKQFFCKDGSKVDVLLAGTFYKDSRSEGIAYILNISERKKNEHLIAFRLQLDEALRGLTDIQQIQYEAACTLGRYFGAHRVGYAEDYGDGQRVRVTRNYTNGIQGIEGIYFYDDYGPALLDTLKKGLTVVRSDIANDPSLSEREKEAHAVLELGATVNVPLTKDGKLFGILFLHYKNAYHFNKSEIALIEETAQRTWAALETARAQAALEASEQKYYTLFDSIDEGYIIIELIYDDAGKPVDFKYLEVNRSFERHTGLKDAVGKYGHELTPNTENVWFETYHRVLKTGEPVRFEEYNAFTNKWYSTFAFAIGTSGENTIAILFSDITTTKLTEQQLRENESKLQLQVAARTNELSAANAALRQINSELSRTNTNLEEFAHAASHDLKEPIRKIRFFANRLKERLESRLADEEAYLLSKVESASLRMDALVNDLLVYSHLGHQPMEREMVDIDVLLSQVLEDLELDIAESGAVLRTHQLPKIQGHKRQLQQLFQNLISNAIKYRKPDAVPRITITAAETSVNDKQYICLSVADNGIGFDMKYADVIFKLFSRLHGKSEYPGTGIGLSIVKKVVENHNGFIEVVTADNQGATFKIYLPIG